MAAAICSSRYMLLEDMPSGPHNGCAWRLIPAHQSRAAVDGLGAGLHEYLITQLWACRQLWQAVVRRQRGEPQAAAVADCAGASIHRGSTGLHRAHCQGCKHLGSLLTPGLSGSSCCEMQRVQAMLVAGACMWKNHAGQQCARLRQPSVVQAGAVHSVS